MGEKEAQFHWVMHQMHYDDASPTAIAKTYPRGPGLKATRGNQAESGDQWAQNLPEKAGMWQEADS